MDEDNVSVELDYTQNEKHFKALKLTGVLLLITPFFIVFGMTIDIWNISHSPLKTNSQGSNVTCDYLKWIRLTNTLHLGLCVSGKKTFALRRDFISTINETQFFLTSSNRQP